MGENVWKPDDAMIRPISAVIDTHRTLERGQDFPAECDRCACGWERLSASDPGTYRWHVAVHVAEAAVASGALIPRKRVETLIEAARATLPIVSFDARDWDEGGSEYDNRRRQADSALILERLRAALAGLDAEEGE